jgi:hypothetical protein
MAKPPPSAYLHAMVHSTASGTRRTAYILVLAVIWAASMAALALGLEGLEHPPFVPHALLAGAYFGALSTVSLAEEISEWRADRNRTGGLPCRWEGWC